ncbi:MAG: cbb3-type cytochrome c oxidase subunit I [bacterium]|nr:cbb3-type cytochrome c oxidase subunit I [bacterium]
MEGFVKRFILMGIVYLMVASVLGVVMVVQPGALELRFAHVHLNLLGWMSMLIFGVGYHILPRFSGKPLHSNRLGEVQFWLANVGLIGMALIATTGQTTSGDPLYSLYLLSALIEIGSIVVFGYNMILTLFVDKAPG